MKKGKSVLLLVTILLFIINTIAVKLNLYASVDETVHIHLLMMLSQTTDFIMKKITFLASTKFIMLLTAVLTITYLRFNKTKSVCIPSLVLTSTVLNNTIKLIVRRPRPEYIMVVEKTFSYPSGHTMAAVTLYGLLIYFLIKSSLSQSNKVVGITLLSTLILLIGISRIYLGAHFFSDVIGGALFSLILLETFAVLDDKYKIIKG